MKGHVTLTRALELEPHHPMQFSVITRSALFVWFLTLCKGVLTGHLVIVVIIIMIIIIIEVTTWLFSVVILSYLATKNSWMNCQIYFMHKKNSSIFFSLSEQRKDMSFLIHDYNFIAGVCNVRQFIRDIQSIILAYLQI